MDSKGAWRYNVFVERLWRTIVAAEDLYSPTPRYLISLGARMVAWEDHLAIPRYNIAYYNL